LFFDAQPPTCQLNLIPNFAGNDGACQVQREFGIGIPLVLKLAQRHVQPAGTHQPAQQPAAGGEEEHRDLAGKQGVDGGGGHAHPAQQHHVRDLVQPGAKEDFVLQCDQQALILHLQPGAGFKDI